MILQLVARFGPDLLKNFPSQTWNIRFDGPEPCKPTWKAVIPRLIPLEALKTHRAQAVDSQVRNYHGPNRYTNRYLTNTQLTIMSYQHVLSTVSLYTNCVLNSSVFQHFMCYDTRAVAAKMHFVRLHTCMEKLRAGSAENRHRTNDTNPDPEVAKVAHGLFFEKRRGLA